MLLAALLAAPAAARSPTHERLVVLETEGADVDLAQRVQLADAVRRGARAAAAGRSVVVLERREMALGVEVTGACTGELPACATKVGRALAAVYAVVGEATIEDGGGVTLELVVVDAATGRVLAEETADARTAKDVPLRIEQGARRAVERALQARPPRVGPRSAAATTPRAPREVVRTTKATLLLPTGMVPGTLTVFTDAVQFDADAKATKPLVLEVPYARLGAARAYQHLFVAAGIELQVDADVHRLLVDDRDAVLALVKQRARRPE